MHLIRNIGLFFPFQRAEWRGGTEVVHEAGGKGDAEDGASIQEGFCAPPQHTLFLGCKLHSTKSMPSLHALPF